MGLRALQRLPPSGSYVASRAVLDSLTGDARATTALLSGARLPGAGLAGERLLGRKPIVLAQALGTMDGLGGFPGAAAPTAPFGSVSIAGVVVTAAAALSAIDSARERAEVDAAIAKFSLDRQQARDVLAARAYVWTVWMAPFSFWRLGYVGAPDNAAAARAVMLYERSHPGNLALAVTGRSAAAMAALDSLIEAAVDGFPDAEPLRRTSSIDPALSTSSARARTLLGLQTAGQQLWQAHHLIPFAVVARLSPAIQAEIAKSGWRMDSVENLLALPANLQTYYAVPNDTKFPVQQGPHPTYDAEVSGLLSAATMSKGPVLRASMLSVEQAMTRRLLNKLYGYHRFLN